MKYVKYSAIVTLLLLVGFFLPANSSSELEAMLEEPEKELAAYMTELQVLTHKLGLSIDAENSQLVQFYLHESLVKVEEIQMTLPEYEGVPVALLMERMALPAYQSVREQYDNKASKDYYADLSVAYKGLLNNCNACHASSGREYLRISHNTTNPYLQDFTPAN